MIDTRFYELIAHLWRGGKYAYYWTPDDGEGEKYSYWLTLDPLNAPLVPKLFYDKDAYFSVHPSNMRRSQHERARVTDGDIIAANVFYCEYDNLTAEQKADKLAEMRGAKFKPACVVDSGGGLQCFYWLREISNLDTPEKLQRFSDLQWAFAQWGGGDTSVNDLARVLRIPGTTNHKAKYAPNFPLVAIVEWDTARQYDLADLEPLLQPYIDARAAAKAHTHTPSMGAVGLSDSELLDVLFNSKNGDLYQRLWNGDTGGDWSRADQQLCNGLAWLTGRDVIAMDRLFRQSGLMRDKWRDRAEYRERTLNNAADSAQTVYTPGHVDQDAVDAANSAVGLGSQASSNGAGYTQGATSTYKAPNDPKSDDYIKSLKSLGYFFRLNDLDNSVEVNGQPIDDVIAAEMRTQMRDLGYKGRHIGAMEDAYLAHAGKNRYHPIKDYLQGLRWDGDDHIRMLSRYFRDKHAMIIYSDGSSETVFYVWLKRWLVGAVAKVFAGGVVKAQNAVLVLEGGQNLGKSTFASWLCNGAPNYFIEQSIDPDNKEHERFLAGKWIWEIGEMGSTTRKADRESLKNFLTKINCDFRVPYARKPIKKPALASFVGTVNNEGGFLQDSTGTRRFMTVGLISIDHSYINDIDVDQLWAQAFDLFRSGESWWLLPEEVQKRDELNGDYKVEDPFEGWVRRYFDIDLARADSKTAGWFTTTQEIVSTLKENGVTGDTSGITLKLASTMKELGLEKDRFPKRTGLRGYWGIKIKP